jgi:hypothetical protein
MAFRKPRLEHGSSIPKTPTPLEIVVDYRRPLMKPLKDCSSPSRFLPLDRAGLSLIIALFASLLGVIQLPAWISARFAIPSLLEETRYHETEIKALQKREAENTGSLIGFVKALTIEPQVAFGVTPRAEPIGLGLFLAVDQVSRSGEGTTVMGRIVNASSVDFRDVAFGAVWGKAEGQVTVSRLAPKESASFSVLFRGESATSGTAFTVYNLRGVFCAGDGHATPISH